MTPFGEKKLSRILFQRHPWNLIINSTLGFYLECSDKNEEENDDGEEMEEAVILSNKPSEKVEHFKYLGSTFYSQQR